MFKILIILAIGYVIFEIIEHVIIPLVALITHRRKKSVSGAEGMIGEIGKVKEWSEKEGRVFIHGELWNAISEEPLSKSDKVIILEVEGLILRVKPFSK